MSEDVLIGRAVELWSGWLKESAGPETHPEELFFPSSVTALQEWRRPRVLCLIHTDVTTK